MAVARSPQMAAVAIGEDGGDLGDDREGDLLRRFAAEIEPCRRVERREARRVERAVVIQFLEQLPVPFARAEQPYIRELQGQKAIERSQIAAEIVRHHQRGSLAVRLEIIRELGSVREVMDDPAKGLRELPHGRDLRAGAEEEEPHRQRHTVDERAGAFRDQFRGCQQRGAERLPLIASAEAAGLPALDPGT